MLRASSCSCCGGENRDLGHDKKKLENAPGWQALADLNQLPPVIVGAPVGEAVLANEGAFPTDEAAMKLIYLVLHPSLVVIAGLQDVPE